MLCTVAYPGASAPEPPLSGLSCLQDRCHFEQVLLHVKRFRCNMSLVAKNQAHSCPKQLCVLRQVKERMQHCPRDMQMAFQVIQPYRSICKLTLGSAATKICPGTPHLHISAASWPGAPPPLICLATGTARSVSSASCTDSSFLLSVDLRWRMPVKFLALSWQLMCVVSLVQDWGIMT